MTSTPKNLRKAALLVASLDDDHAAALLAQMTPVQARAIHQAISHLGQVDPAEQRLVIEEFFRVGPLVPEKQPCGIQLDDRLPNHLSISPPSDLVVDGPASRSTGAFRLLRDAPLETWAPLLEQEHPQIVAVVVSHLPPERAAEVLGGLPAPMQIEVARRLVDLDEADPAMLVEVERELEARLCQRVRGDQRRNAGLAALNNILDAASAQAKQHIIANLAQHDRQLAARLKVTLAPELTLVDLEQLDATSLSVVVRHASHDLLVLALAGSDADFADRVCELLGEEGGSLRKALRHLGPTRLSDVEEAQRQLVELARQLELRGEISPSSRSQRRLSVAV